VGTFRLCLLLPLALVVVVALLLRLLRLFRIQAAWLATTTSSRAPGAV
jgi:hypothetical protein